MRSPTTPHQRAGIVLAAVLLPALTITAWPLLLFLHGLLPDSLPVGRILLGALLAAGLAAAAVLARSGTREKKPVWLGWLILAAWTVAIALVAGIVLLVWLVLGSPGLKDVSQLSPQNLDALATRAFAVVAGLGGVALLVIHYRRQRTTEADAVRAEAANVRAERASERETTKLFTERFTTASEQLGSEHAAVRLAGVHALAHLADDAPEGREDLVQMVIDVLCAYLRMPYTPAPDPLPKNASRVRREEHRERELKFASFREVRHTIIRVIGNRLREPTRWCGKDYDFTGTVFDGGTFNGACFTGGKVSFLHTVFCGGIVGFVGTEFAGAEVSFVGAEFRGQAVSFSHARFSRGQVYFSHARFIAGAALFYKAKFVGGRASFEGAIFTGAQVLFAGARFGDTEVVFHRARFEGGCVVFDDQGGYGVALGICPPGLQEASAESPGVLSLPPRWKP